LQAGDPESGLSLACSWEGFKGICAEFLRAADSANADELEAGAKCVGLAYLGIGTTTILCTGFTAPPARPR
jgi:hypothetical protein